MYDSASEELRLTPVKLHVNTNLCEMILSDDVLHKCQRKDWWSYAGETKERQY